MAKNIDSKTLAAAMSTSESDVAVPSRHLSGSLASQIAALALGDSTSKVWAVHGGMTLADFTVQGAALKEQLRNRITPSVQQAKVRTGGSYQVEIGTLVTTANNVYLVAVITRTE